MLLLLRGGGSDAAAAAAAAWNIFMYRNGSMLSFVFHTLLPSDDSINSDTGSVGCH